MDKNIKFVCPDCGKPLDFESSYVENNKVIALMYCDKCNSGLDKDWQVTYSKEKGIEKIERYYWG